jgi:hypothetical protein
MVPGDSIFPFPLHDTLVPGSRIKAEDELAASVFKVTGSREHGSGNFDFISSRKDSLYGPGYRPRSPCWIPGATRFCEKY